MTGFNSYSENCTFINDYKSPPHKMCQALIFMWRDTTTPEIQPLTEKKGDNKNGKTIQTSKTSANTNIPPIP